MMLNTKKLILFMIILLGTLSCGIQENLRGEYPDNFEELTVLLNSGEFEIENEWAMPLNGSMIDLIGNPNQIRFKADTVDIYLPYFGVRHFGGDYSGRDGGIKYEGPVENLVIKENSENQRVYMEFEASKDNERYNFAIMFFANGNTNTNINSSARNSISYRGKIKSLPKSREDE